MSEFEKRSVHGESSWDRCIKDLVDEVQFIALDEKEEHVLVTETDGTLRLPSWFSDNALYRYLPSMRQAMMDIFQSKDYFLVLRCIWREKKDLITPDNVDMGLERSVVVLECQDLTMNIPKRFQWVPISSAVIFHSEARARQAITDQLQLIHSRQEPVQRVPWARPGWFKITSQWVRERLTACGCGVILDISQVSVTPWGTVLKIQTESCDFFLKASPCFNNEGAINDFLSSVAPIRVQKPLTVDYEKRMFISRDHGDCVAFQKLPKPEKRQFLLDLAELQKASLKKVDELRRVGLQTIEPGWLASNLDSLLEHEELSFMKDSEDLKKVKANKSKIIETLRELELVSEGLPMTLVRGDLMSSNVCRVSGEPGRFGFFDWDCAFIGHPLLDALECGYESEAMESYLEAWSDYQPVSILRESLPLLEAVEAIISVFQEVNELFQMERHTRDDSRSNIRLVISWALIRSERSGMGRFGGD